MHVGGGGIEVMASWFMDLFFSHLIVMFLSEMCFERVIWVTNIYTKHTHTHIYVHTASFHDSFITSIS